MSQPPPDFPDDDSPQPAPSWSGPGVPPYYWATMPAGDPRFLPGDPLVSPDFSGWWRRGFAVVRRGWRPLALVQLCTAVPTLALMIPAQLFVDFANRDLTTDAAGGGAVDFGHFLAASGMSLLATLVATLVFAIGSLVTMTLVVAIATGAQARIGTAVRGVLPRIPALIGWSLVAALILTAALFACVLPVFYVGAVFVVLTPVVLFERGGAIGRCFNLFHTDIGAAVARIATIAGVSIAISLAFAAVSAAVTLLVGGASFSDPFAVADTGAMVVSSVTGTVLSTVASLICGVVLTPLIVATYADLRARREPFTTADLISQQ
ncbi:hypothetical protein [Actinoplanes sp. NPDC049681]|uniref:hypothetical protein n=1 Tax=Actinoplanes sp. NPDC049681 TaxID=3363905 RepID=UPI0037A3C6F7